MLWKPPWGQRNPRHGLLLISNLGLSLRNVSLPYRSTRTPASWDEQGSVRTLRNIGCCPGLRHNHFWGTSLSSSLTSSLNHTIGRKKLGITNALKPFFLPGPQNRVKSLFWPWRPLLVRKPGLNQGLENFSSHSEPTVFETDCVHFTFLPLASTILTKIGFLLDLYLWPTCPHRCFPVYLNPGSHLLHKTCSLIMHGHNHPRQGSILDNTTFCGTHGTVLTFDPESHHLWGRHLCFWPNIQHPWPAPTFFPSWTPLFLEKPGEPSSTGGYGVNLMINFWETLGIIWIWEKPGQILDCTIWFILTPWILQLLIRSSHLRLHRLWASSRRKTLNFWNILSVLLMFSPS